MLLTITSYAQTPSSLTVSDGSSTPPYAIMSDQIQWGNASFEHTYSAPRGTQGRKAASGIVQNRQVVLPLRVYGTSKDVLASNLKTLGMVVDELRRFGGRLTWQSVGQSYRQHLEVMGSDGAELQGWNNRAENRNIAQVDVSLSCAPYAQGDSMDVADVSFSSLSDYTFDSGASTNLTVASGQVKVTSNSTTEHRLVHSQRGYTLGDTEVTVNILYSQTSGYKAGVVFWRTSATSYWTAYLDDTGSATRLRIDQSVSGTVTNRASTTLGTRLTNGSGQWVRIRSEGTSLTASQWTASPTPAGTPANTATYTASAAGSGLAGLVFTPQTSTPYVDSLIIRPFTYSAKTSPALINLTGSIPGDVPANASVELTTVSALQWALVAWQTTPGTSTLSGTPKAAFTVFNGNDDISASRQGWSTVDTGVNSIRTTSATSSGTYSASYALDPSLLPGDSYTSGDRSVQVWALVHTDRSSRLINPVLTASLSPATGSAPTRYTDEYGSGGRTSPTQSVTASSTGYKWTNLGTLHIPASGARQVNLVIRGTVGAGSASGQFGLVRVCLTPARSRAALPTGRDGSASSYPDWSLTTTETVKTINTDLTTSAFQPSTDTVGLQEQSVSGSPLEFPSGTTSLLMIVAKLVPDDPTALTTVEASSSTAAVHVGIVPRFAQLRS